MLQSLDFKQFNLIRDVNTGSPVLTDITTYVLRKKQFASETLNYSEALLKVIDEIISNAIEALIAPKAPEYGKLGTELTVTYLDDYITIKNTGPGYPIYVENGVYSVQKCLATEYTSSHYDDSIASNSCSTNGIGSKLTNIYSKFFEITTCCFKTKIKYHQVFENNLSIIHPPKLEDYLGEPYTEIRFLLDFDKLCRIDKQTHSENWIKTNSGLVYALLERRTYEAAVYLSNFGYYRVTFNNQDCSVDFTKFVNMHPHDYIVTEIIELQECEIKQFFKVAVLIHNPVQLNETTFCPYGHDHVSILNAGVLPQCSNYVDAMMHKIEQYIIKQPEYEEFGNPKSTKINTKILRDHITFISIGSYNKQCFSYVSQSKTQATFDKKSLNYFKATFNFSDEFCKKIWKHLYAILPKIYKVKNRVKTKLKPKLYEPATNASTKKGAEALFVVEGNSAATLMRKIIEKNPRLSRNDYGIYSIQGVPINAIKNSTEYPTGLKQNQKLIKNDGLQALVHVLGLNYDRACKPKYKNIILSTDQDSDGIGKICSLLICFFMLYFPDLVKAGFIKRFRTPIIRATLPAKYGSKRVDFYDDSEFEKMNEELGGILKGDYYKGLGTHDREDVDDMAANYFKNLIQVTYDDAGRELMYVLYDQATTQRKLELMYYPGRGTYKNDVTVTLHEHFTLESIPEQLNNIHRMTPHVVDGLTPAQRKTLATIRRSNSVMKVSALCGEVIAKMNYAHGEASLESVIKRMAQIFTGSNKVPLILPVSDSNGTQFGGKKDTASARYTKIKPNPLMRIYYPIEDDDILEYVEEEGGQYEPEFYVPVVPRVLMEDIKAIATGWNTRHVARRYTNVMYYVKKSIEQNKPEISELHGYPEIYPGMKCIVIGNKEYIIGSYEKYQNQIVVTQLPIGLWGKKFMENIANKNIVESIRNESGDKLRIVINLHENSVIPEDPDLDPIIAYFGIYVIAGYNLNFYSKHLREYKCRNEVFQTWFHARRELYQKRIAKQKVRLEAMIELLENTYHFLKNDRGTIDDLDDDERENILSQTHVVFTDGTIRSGYTRLNAPKITNTQQCDAETLKKIMYDGNYDYIYNLKKSQTSKKYLEKLLAEIQETRKTEILDWQNLWLKELREFHNRYIKAREVKWFYKCDI